MHSGVAGEPEQVERFLVSGGEVGRRVTSEEATFLQQVSLWSRYLTWHRRRPKFLQGVGT